MKSPEDYYQGKVRGRLSEQQISEQADDIRHRSITPDTHKGRVMSENLQDFNSQQLINDPLSVVQEQFGLEEQTVDYPFYVDSYTHPSLETSRVLHFGINAHRQELREELSIYNEQLRKGLPKTGGLDKMSNISGESNYGKFIDCITPIAIESTIVSNAIQFLRDTGNKIVLVDVFPRVLNSKAEGMPVGTIKLDGNIETHTALLYTAGEKILVIDPNNPQFSAFLKNVNPNIIESSYRANDKIYMRAGESGPESWRDCIDIAVKLAFLLNASGNIYYNIKSIMDSCEIKWITNNSEIDRNIFYLNSNPIREKQKSDLQTVESFNQNLAQKNILFNEYQDSLDKAKKLADQRLLQIFEIALTNHSDISLDEVNETIQECFLIGEQQYESEI